MSWSVVRKTNVINQEEEDKQDHNRIRAMTMDISSLAFVRAFAKAYFQQYSQESIDMIFMNAGSNFMPSPGQDRRCAPKTQADGIDMLFQVNYSGHHLMYRLLEPLVQKSKNAKIVQTSSASSFETYSYKVATDWETLHGC